MNEDAVKIVNESTLLCKEESLFEELFPKQKNYEMFYDEGTKCFLFRLECALF